MQHKKACLRRGDDIPTLYFENSNTVEEDFEYVESAGDRLHTADLQKRNSNSDFNTRENFSYLTSAVRDISSLCHNDPIKWKMAKTTVDELIGTLTQNRNEELSIVANNDSKLVSSKAETERSPMQHRYRGFHELK